MSEEEVSPSDIYLQDKVVFEKGKKYLIKANSGHGKSSILNFIYGSNVNFQGEINYLDSSNDANVFEYRKTKISYVFQDFKLFSDLTIFENIQLKNTLTNHKTHEEIDDLIERVLLKHKRNSLIKTLSLGQRQRVAVLRAICQPFDYILLDEPFSHLDNTNIKILTDILNEETKKQNSSLILTSLDSEYLFDYDKVLNL
ncbi:MAG: ATP-binding cassette domain-containing protein [Flavobacteriaceae bacterium]